MAVVPPREVMARLDELIAMGRAVKRSADPVYADTDEHTAWRTAAVAWLERVLGRDDAYTRRFSDAADTWYYEGVTSGTAILVQVKADVEGGYLTRFAHLVAAGILADVWQQARELLDQGYKDAAALLGATALEVGLKQYAEARGVPRDGGIGALNLALSRAGAYSAVRQQQIDAWRVLRNAAAHGDTDAYSESDVRTMLDGVQSFLADVL